jgi:hypothetical protein
MLIRRLNDLGIEEFRKQLAEIRSGNRKDFDGAFLTDENTSVEIVPKVDLQMKVYEDKAEIAKMLVEKLNLGHKRALYYDIGLWTWLSGFFFDLVCPISKGGDRSVGADARYILAEPKNWTRYYRHLLASSARILCELGDLAKPFLASPIHIWGDFHEQLMAYQGIATNKALIGTAYRLYWDENAQRLKRGSGSKGPGSPRRFSDVVGQFELTYDLNAMESKDIIELFPDREFNKWKSN